MHSGKVFLHLWVEVDVNRLLLEVLERPEEGLPNLALSRSRIANWIR